MVRPKPATKEQQRTAAALNKRIDAMTQETVDAVRTDIRAAYTSGNLTLRQLTAIRDKFGWIVQARGLVVERL